MLETRGLTAHYGDFQALYGIDTVIGPGETIAIIGANGAGKSSYLKAITGLIRAEPDSVRSRQAHRRARRGEYSQARDRDGTGGAAALLLTHGRGNLLIGSYGRNVAGIWSLDSIYGLFPPLKERRTAPSHALSGGEQQMTAIGRALMSNPRVLLCDEISLGLAPIVIRNIYDAMPRIKQTGTSIVLVEQDIAQAMKVADRVYCFQEGRVSLSGRPEELTREQVHLAISDTEHARLARHDHQGVLLGGLYALVRRRPVADLRHHAAGQSRPWRSDRAGGVRDSLAGDVAWFRPFSCDSVAMPAMFAAGFALQHVLLNRALGSDLLPPCWSHSLVHYHSKRLARGVYTADSRRLRLGAIETASIELGGKPGDRSHAAAPRLALPSRWCCCSICCFTAPRWAGRFARRPMISKSRS